MSEGKVMNFIKKVVKKSKKELEKALNETLTILKQEDKKDVK